jgi:NitT/TauT family transport system permease protein
MEIAVVAFTCFFPVLMLSQTAVANVEPRLLEMATVIGLSRPQQVWKIVLPAALPRIFVALRLAAGIALVVAVTVEIAANPYGLGYGLMIAQQSLRPDLMFAFLLWIGVLGWSLNALMVALQHRLFNPLAMGAGR